MPDPNVEILVRMDVKECRFAVMVYDARERLWFVPKNGRIMKQAGFPTCEIFAWSPLPMEKGAK